MENSAIHYLHTACRTLADRGKQYDKSQQQERSMQAIVKAFNIVTDRDLTEAEGWAFMQVLKLVRLHSNTDNFHEDSAVDGIAYAALAAECMSKNENPRT